MKKEKTTTARIYEKDSYLVDKIIEKHTKQTRADVIRIALEYSNAHGVFS